MDYRNIYSSKGNKKEFIITSKQMEVYQNSTKNPESINYNVPYYYKLKKGVNIERIKKGIIEIIKKQDILRSRYIEKEVNGKIEIYGIIEDKNSFKFEEYHYENVQKFIRPFNLKEGPLLRVGFINSEVLLIDMHQIISDGNSISILCKELNNYYNKDGNEGESISKLEIQFSDYAYYLKEMKNGEQYNKQIEFFKGMFKNNYSLLNIPKKEDYVKVKSNESSESKKYKTFIKEIPKNISMKIDVFINDYNINKTAFFMSIYGFVISKYSRQENIYSSIMSANKNNNVNLANIIGRFDSTQPILLKYDNDKKTFIDLINETMDILMTMNKFQDISFNEISKTINLKPCDNTFIYLSNNVIYNDNMNNSIFDDYEKINYCLMHENKYEIFQNNNNKFDISCYIIENGNTYEVIIEFNNNKYKSNMINRILESYLEVLNQIDQFKNNISEIEYIPETEKEKIIKNFNDNDYKYKLNKLFHEEFRKVARKNNDKSAIIYDGKEISYGKLDEMSNSLAHFLRNQGVKRGDIIPIVSERSYYYIVAIIGIMKSGGAYLPIDPEFPKNRIEYMIEEVNAKLVLKYITDETNDKKLKLNNPAVKIFSLEHYNYNENTEDIKNINSGEDLCYVIFTSGTTGKPKGTMITHNNLINYCLYSQTINGNKDIFETEIKSALAFSKFTFDMSV
ncbi:hypothetical protein PIROE2DRAFT_18291, partial [Piromyces sp. E2]